MGNYGNYSVRTSSESEAILTLATDLTEEKMRANEPFTALDISNALKAKNLPVRHREVSAVVRGLYLGGGMTSYGYDRELIAVETDNGDKAQAYLYHPTTQPKNDYTNTAQDALPPVPSDRARALDDAVPSGIPLTDLAKAALVGMVGNAVINGNGTTLWGKAHGTRTRNPYRQDGAIAVPRTLIAQAGWQTGDTLQLSHDPATDALILHPISGANNTPGILVRVWADLRVRIARTKLRITGSVIGNIPAQKPNFSVDANGLRIQP